MDSKADTKANIRIFEDIESLNIALAQEFQAQVDEAASHSRFIHVAVSGGNTPRSFFACLATKMKDRISWKYLHLYWVDERCVPPDHAESNYGMTRDTLLQHVPLPATNIHRIQGEEVPERERERYIHEILDCVPGEHSPRFDWIFLGMGSDGHTASLFPGQEAIWASQKICEVATHPKTGQKRITLTLKAINRSARVTFVVAGEDKAKAFAEVTSPLPEVKKYPAAHVKPVTGRIEWYVDKQAATHCGPMVQKLSK
jgi:6-phosphogluconolactonase